MSLDELSRRCGKTWPAITKAKADAASAFDRLQQLLQEEAARTGSIESQDISLVVFGSMGRGEWTSGSDLDWTLLIDGEADHEHANTAHRAAHLLHNVGNFNRPGRTGVFGHLAFSHNIIHQIGGPDDSNRNTTQRLLLLLESRPAQRPDAYRRVVVGIVRRYLQNDFRAFRLQVPRFLLNDLHRFWRTMCVDYASKYRERASEGWALRNIKLRMSRKLIFAAGLLICYSCDPRLLARARPDLVREPTIEGLAEQLCSFVGRPPLDLVAEALSIHADPSTADALLTAYDAFLARLDDSSARNHLEQLPPEKAEADPLFRELQAHGEAFQEALARFFFDGGTDLAALTRTYGVF